MSKNAINYKLSIYYKKNHKVNAPVLIGDKWGVIDKNGKYLTNPQFDEMCYGVANQSTDYVESEYYDASKTISLFLKQYDFTNVSFDGFSKNTTLQDVIDSPKYGDFADCLGDGYDYDDDKNHYVTIVDDEISRIANINNLTEKDRRIIKNYSIGGDLFIFPIGLFFQNQICSRENYYSPKTYAFDEHVSGAIYLILTQVNAIGKATAVIEELKKQIVAKTNVKFKEIGELDAALSEKNNFAIMELDDETILFMVGFDSYAQKTIKKWGDLDVESSDLYDYLIDLVDLFSWTLNLFDYE